MCFSEFIQNEDKKSAFLPARSIHEVIPSGVFTEYTLKNALREAGFTVPVEEFVHSSTEAISAAERIGYPVVLKVVSEEIQHKTEVGGVKINIKNTEELLGAYREMDKRVKQEHPDKQVKGFLVQKMVDQGIEMLIGATNRLPYGTVVTVGFGGIWVELMKDITYRQAPFSLDEAIKMLKELNGYQMLEGYRGGQAVNLKELGRFISKFSTWVASIQDFKEIELNPVIVSGDSIKIVDALCIPK
jgi:succinyl-CoA synthetase beta subunit